MDLHPDSASLTKEEFREDLQCAEDKPEDKLCKNMAETYNNKRAKDDQIKFTV